MMRILSLALLTPKGSIEHQVLLNLNTMMPTIQSVLPCNLVALPTPRMFMIDGSIQKLLHSYCKCDGLEIKCKKS